MKKWEDLLSLSALFWVLVLLNVHAGHLFFRVDLTEEKRYSISPATIRLLEELDDEVFVEVFLAGELNADFQRLQQSIRQTLEEFQVYADGRLSFSFTDPSDAPNEKARNRFYQQLAQKGLSPTNLFDKGPDGQRIQKIIFPGALFTFQGKEQPVMLLKGNKNASPQEQLNQSVEGIEYELANAIRQMTAKARRRIAFVEGHDELTAEQTADITATLRQTYVVDRVRIAGDNLQAYDAVIIAQPKKSFGFEEQYAVDQYLMHGGKLFCLIDRVQMNIDSIGIGGTYAFGYQTDLEDLLFRYGVRCNVDLLQDQQAGLIDLYTGQMGENPNIQQVPWPYYVYLNNFSQHPIVRNLDVVYAKFLGSIDTVKTKGVTKTPLMFTSPYTRVKRVPTMVSFDELRQEVRRELYTSKLVPVAYLLEGKFQSYFANNPAPKTADPAKKKTVSEGGKIIVVSDADLLRNELDRKTKEPLPIDYDPARRQALSNREFVVNALAWLTDENGIIATRAKQITLRPLDTFRLREERLFWQVLNIGLPVVLTVVAGILLYYLRRRRYGR